MEFLDDFFVLVGRVCIGAMFLWGAYEKITHWQANMNYMKMKNVPQPSLVLPTTVTLKIIGGFTAMLGWHAHIGALLLLAVSIPSVIWFHPFWKVGGPEKGLERAIFMREVTVIGGLFLLLAMGAGNLAFGGG